MKKVGRKQALSVEQAQRLRARLANYYRAIEQDSPQAIAQELNISLSAVRAYRQQLHKGEPGTGSRHPDCDILIPGRAAPSVLGEGCSPMISVETSRGVR